MIRSLVVHEDGTHEVRVIAERGRLVMDAESGRFSIEDDGNSAEHHEAVTR